MSAYDIVKTLPANELSVMIEQHGWKKTYSAKGRVETDVAPLAPVGTTGQLIVRDMTTGEELTVKYRWVSSKPPLLLARLVKFIVGLFNKPK